MSGDERPAPCGFDLGRRYHNSRCNRLCLRMGGHLHLVHRCACGVTAPVEGSSCRHAKTTKAMIGRKMFTLCAACEMNMEVFPGDPEDDGLDGWDELYSNRGDMPAGDPPHAFHDPSPQWASDEAFVVGAPTPEDQDMAYACGERAPGGSLVCTRVERHPGAHVADDGREVLQVWGREATPGAEVPCPTCSGPVRETVGLVCQTCGTDYGAEEAASSAFRAALRAVTPLVSPVDADAPDDDDTVSLRVGDVRLILEHAASQWVVLAQVKAVVDDAIESMDR